MTDLQELVGLIDLVTKVIEAKKSDSKVIIQQVFELSKFDLEKISKKIDEVLGRMRKNYPCEKTLTFLVNSALDASKRNHFVNN